ncbi:MAG: DGQHR domain-containing protein [Rhodospirillales bacterium]|nr:DGQHR domain-containing protein [Alphaproteobacteria bacterium]MBL6948794.1 DGQHR domain-containing protein [Rhodospirillales bacterium]
MNNPNNENDTTLTFDALRVSQPVGEFFLINISARKLVSIAYADVRRLEAEERDVEKYLGIQRPLKDYRVNEIRAYIQGPYATFPTAIILAVDEKCAEYDAKNKTLTLHPYEDEVEPENSISQDKIGKILDGQHRIAGFFDKEWNFIGDFEGGKFDLNASIFIGADLPEQANIFATVNLAQTKVNKSLVYDLAELARAPTPFKFCHNIAVALDSTKASPFFKRIKRLGVATPGRENEPLTQAAFVESLIPFISAKPFIDQRDQLRGKTLSEPTEKELAIRPLRSLFIRNEVTDAAEIIFNYFKAIQNKWPKAWDAIEKKGNLLPKTNAFKAFMRFLRTDVYPKIAGDKEGYIPKPNEFIPFLKNVDLNDQEFTTSKFVPGSGGEASFLKLLRGQISKADIVESE